MNYTAELKKKITNNKSISTLLTVAIIIVSGYILKKVADNQSRVAY